MTLPAPSILAALRRDFALLKASALSPPPARRISYDDAPAMACIGEKLIHSALHEIAAARESEMAAAMAFTFVFAARCAPRRAMLWIADDMMRTESGALYGPGLSELGLAMERLVAIGATRSGDVLWTMEEALRCRGVGVVIGEIRSDDRGIDLLATRRLSLAAARSGGLAFLVRTAPGAEPSAATTRWIVGTVPSLPVRHGVGPPRMTVRLVRNRHGCPGSWILEWDRAKRCFAVAPENRERMAEPARDRPHRAATAGA